MRLRRAGLIASAQRSMSLKAARESPQMTAFRLRLAISCTAAKSPSEAIGKPASMISTPIVSSNSATSSFSSCVMVAPGHCSPSRKVVSKMRTRSFSDWGAVDLDAALFGAVFVCADLAGLVVAVFMARSLVVRARAGLSFPWLGANKAQIQRVWLRVGDPLSAQAQRPSRPSGGDKEQEPAQNEGRAAGGR